VQIYRKQQLLANDEHKTNANVSKVHNLVKTNYIQTRSNGAVHTSAKARLTSVAIQIRIRIPDPDRHQMLIICSLAYCQPPSKFHADPFESFCAKLLTNRQTDRQTTTKKDLLGGGNRTQYTSTNVDSQLTANVFFILTDVQKTVRKARIVLMH